MNTKTNERTTKKQRIATRFDVGVERVTYVNGKGWFYNEGTSKRFLHRSFYELQHTPAWATRRIHTLWISD